MASPSWENIDAFFILEKDGGFATPATVRPMDGRDDYVIPVIFDDPYLNAELGEYEMDTATPTALAPDKYVGGILRGMELIIYGNPYGVRSVDPKGQGTSTIVLDFFVIEQPDPFKT